MQKPPSQQKQQYHSQIEFENHERLPTMNNTAAPNTLQLTNRLFAPATESVTSDENELDYPDARYECAICIHWLNDPVLTTCGHRFCKSCLNSWMRNHNQCCPLDNSKLSAEHDIFPDNCTRREIGQIRFKCPNSPLGCSVVASPIEVDRHLPTCPYRRQDLAKEKCPFASVKCEFVGRPETNALEEHLKVDMPHHMQLMLQALQQTAIATWNPQKSTSSTSSEATAPTNGHTTGVGILPPPPPQYANDADELMQAMYQRIVVLEQRAHEQEVKIENLTKQLTLERQQVDPRYGMGTIIWEIANFQNLVGQLRASTNNQIYSRGCYTSPYGYKYCARLKIQPERDHLLSLHIHLMQSENDYHLDWPFNARIKLCMIHPRDPKLSQHDTIMTNPEILAFHQPRERISTRGFGFVEYANINEMIHKGFCEGDRIVIKIQINVV